MAEINHETCHFSEQIFSADVFGKANSKGKSDRVSRNQRVWNDETIRQSIEKFLAEHQRLPSVKELDTCPELPGHMVILNRYHVSAMQWLVSRFPKEQLPLSIAKQMNSKALTPEELGRIFAAEFQRIRPASARMYNLERDPATPSWEYIARRNGISRWTQLKKRFHVRSPSGSRTGKLKVVHHITVQMKRSAGGKNECELLKL